MNFEYALQLIKQGRIVQRSGWNGKGMFLVLVKGYEWSWNKIYALPVKPYLGSFIAMKTADDMLVPWLASQTDILADDWQEFFS